MVVIICKNSTGEKRNLPKRGKSKAQSYWPQEPLFFHKGLLRNKKKEAWSVSSEIPHHKRNTKLRLPLHGNFHPQHYYP